MRRLTIPTNRSLCNEEAQDKFLRYCNQTSRSLRTGPDRNVTDQEFLVEDTMQIVLLGHNLCDDVTLAENDQ